MKKYKLTAVLAAAVLLLAACTSEQPAATQTRPTESATAEFGGRSSWEYTWEEFERMSAADPIALQESFGSLEAFEQWRLRVQATRVDIPWENGGKQPEEYTLEEYEALSATLQALFENSFESRTAFEEWMLAAQYAQIGVPWADGGKEPGAYTWAEFEALTAQQQILFQNSFETIDAFDRWMQQAQQAQEPTVDLGDKPLTDYTWEEFEAMSIQEQMAFQNSFESLEAFDQWLQQAQWDAQGSGWEGEKRPEDYTWAEFEALPADQQIIFQSSFDTEDGFEQWLLENMPE